MLTQPFVFHFFGRFFQCFSPAFFKKQCFFNNCSFEGGELQKSVLLNFFESIDFLTKKSSIPLGNAYFLWYFNSFFYMKSWFYRHKMIKTRTFYQYEGSVNFIEPKKWICYRKFFWKIKTIFYSLEELIFFVIFFFA